MIIISHRGNINGPNIERENKPDYIQEALDLGFDVEVDVWVKDEKLFLGHDGPETEVDITFLLNDSIWCHAKNGAALSLLLKQGAHCFFIKNDDLTLTSSGVIYGYSGRDTLPIGSVSIFEVNLQSDVMGVCTDYPLNYVKNDRQMNI